MDDAHGRYNSNNPLSVMDIIYHGWDEFKFETIEKQIQERTVSVGFKRNGAEVRIQSKPEGTEWNIWITFIQDSPGVARVSKRVAREGVPEAEVTEALREAIDLSRKLLTQGLPSTV